jgi:flagellar basal body-associated protein FliL
MRKLRRRPVTAICCVAAVAACAFLFVSPADASGSKSKKADEKPKKEVSLREKFALPSHVQLSAMMVPIRHSYQRSSAITIFLEPVKRESVGKICNNVPRIRDAILQLLSRAPIETENNRMVLDDELFMRFTMAINDVLDEEKIKGVHVEPGIVNLAGQQGGISRLPFATVNGCSGIKQLEEKLKEAEKPKGH